MRKELEHRLIDLALTVNEICNHLDESFLSGHISRQIIRSSSSAAMNYGEAQSSESRNDFIHKISVVLKELRETNISLRLLQNSVEQEYKQDFVNCQGECDQLIAIFHRTVMSARKNNQ